MTSSSPRGARGYCQCLACGLWVELILATYRPVDHAGCPAPYPPPKRTAVYDQSVHGQQPPDAALVKHKAQHGPRVPDAPTRPSRSSRPPRPSRFSDWAMSRMSEPDMDDEFRDRSTGSLVELARRLAALPTGQLNAQARAKHAAIRRELARRDRARISNAVSRSLQQSIDRGSVPKTGARFILGGLPTLGRDR